MEFKWLGKSSNGKSFLFECKYNNEVLKGDSLGYRPYIDITSKYITIGFHGENNMNYDIFQIKQKTMTVWGIEKKKVYNIDKDNVKFFMEATYDQFKKVYPCVKNSNGLFEDGKVTIYKTDIEKRDFKQVNINLLWDTFCDNPEDRADMMIFLYANYPILFSPFDIYGQ